MDQLEQEKARVLYITYDGLLEPLAQTQVAGSTAGFHAAPRFLDYINSELVLWEPPTQEKHRQIATAVVESQ